MTQTVLLGDEIELIGGGTPKTSIPEYWNGLVPWLSVADFGNDRRWVGNTEKSITEAGLKNSSTKLLNAGDIIISARGTVGEIAQLRLPMAFNQSCYGIRAGKNLNQDYLYYLLKYSIADLQRQAHGGVFSTITRETFQHIKAELPLLEIQKNIAEILGSFDEKIELNRRMNKTLEQMGQALFKHYFIDNPAAKTWPEDKITNLGVVITGKTPSKAKSEYFGGGLLFLKVPDMHGQSIVIKTNDSLTEKGAYSQKGKTIPKYSTCVSCIATVGLVSLAGSELQTNQQINSILPVRTEYRFYNYLLLLEKSDLIKVMASGGTATLNLNKGQFETVKVVIPPIDLLREFDSRILSTFQTIELNMRETENLIELRDSLLSHLISGKTKI